jgi:hypothetical protein
LATSAQHGAALTPWRGGVQDDEAKKAFVSVNWVLCEGDVDIETQARAP